MHELLRDSVWTFIGAVLAVVAIAVTIAVYFGQRERKRIAVDAIARVPLVALGKKGVEGLSIMFNGESIANATIVLVRIASIGNRPILAADFESPIALEFANEAQVLAADVVSTRPDRLPTTVEVAGRLAIVSRSLLNPGDSIICRILIKNSDGKFAALGRIAGVKRIEGAKRTSLVFPLCSLVALVLLIGSFVLSPSPMSMMPLEIRKEELPYLAIMLLGSLVMLVGTIADLRTRLRRIREQKRYISGEEA